MDIAVAVADSTVTVLGPVLRTVLVQFLELFNDTTVELGHARECADLRDLEYGLSTT